MHMSHAEMFCKMMMNYFSEVKTHKFEAGKGQNQGEPKPKGESKYRWKHADFSAQKQDE